MVVANPERNESMRRRWKQFAIELALAVGIVGAIVAYAFSDMRLPISMFVVVVSGASIAALVQLALEYKEFWKLPSFKKRFTAICFIHSVLMYSASLAVHPLRYVIALAVLFLEIFIWSAVLATSEAGEDLEHSRTDGV